VRTPAAWKLSPRLLEILVIALALATLAVAVLPNRAVAQARKEPGFDVGPPNIPAIAAAAAWTPVAPALFQPSWESLKEHYRVPQPFRDGKFGLCLHWGVYAMPGYHNEWHGKHMYNAYVDWHAERFGPQDLFGYKDFIPWLTREKFDPDAWATRFGKSRAKPLHSSRRARDESP
jgi:alpha-L-fucosidase